MANRSRCPFCSELHETRNAGKVRMIDCPNANYSFPVKKNLVVERTADGHWRFTYPTGRRERNAFDGTMSRANHKRDIYKGSGSTPKPGRDKRVPSGVAADLAALQNI